MTQGFGTLRLLEDPPGEPHANMMRDEQIAAEVCAGEAPPTLRFYGWLHPAISLGRRQRLEEIPPKLRSSGRAIVWRPTGGGAVLHDADDFTYASALPCTAFQGRLKPVDISVWIHRQLREQLECTGLLERDELMCAGNSKIASVLCFKAPVCGDLLYQNQKVAGSALRVWRGGLLIQGSIQGLPVDHKILAECLEVVCRQFLVSRF